MALNQTATVTERDRGHRRFSRDIVQLGHKAIKVGFMGDETIESVTVTDYAMYNEFGTSRGIPARPFMSKTADEQQEDLFKYAQFLAGKLADGNMSADQVLNTLGLRYQGEVQKTIRNAKDWAVPNTPETIARKGSSSPLIDTGRMIGAVRYEVIDH